MADCLGAVIPYYDRPMKALLLALLVLAGLNTVAAESPTPERPWPLWDNLESVEQYAQHVNLPPTKTLDLGKGVKLELVLIPAGQFIMGTPEPETPKETVAVGQTIVAVSGVCALGLLLVMAVRAVLKRQRPKFSLGWLLVFTFAVSVALYGGVRWHKTVLSWREFEAAQARNDAAYDKEKPAHPVTLTQPFYMGKFVVTQEQYQTMIGSNPSHFKGKDNPVESVSWDDARAFCKKLAEQTKQTVRMPSEAEWEYACRAGTTTTYHSGDAEADLARVAWYWENSKGTTHPVGQKEPNLFGLYDMHGNVWQWCEDWDDYYGKSAVENPQGPAQGIYRLVRGGTWAGLPGACWSAHRVGYFPGDRGDFIGFRVALAPASRIP